MVRVQRSLFVIVVNINVLACRYAKIEDVDNWLTIDEKTADIKLNKFPDRESTFLINGTYYAKIICITKGKCSSCR